MPAEIGAPRESWLVQVSPCYVDLKHESGGVANIVRQICLQMDRNGKHVLLLCGNTELGRVVARPGTEIFGNITRIVLAATSSRLFTLKRDIAYNLSRVPLGSVAHVHTCFSALTEYAMECLATNHIPFVFTPHGKLSKEMMFQKYWLKRAWWEAVAKSRVRKSSKLAVSGIGETELFSKLGLDMDVVTIPNGYVLPEGELLPSKWRDPYVLFLGYLDPRKQPSFLVNAFAESQSCRTHKLVLVGPDLYGHQTAVERAADDCGVKDRVVFYGPAYGEEKWNLLRHADCLCLPSLGEGLPVVLCEALGAGLPTVYSQQCNFPEVAAHGAGVMLDNFVASCWAAAMDSICTNSALRDRMKAAATELGGEYTWQQIAIRWNAVYDSMISQSE